MNIDMKIDFFTWLSTFKHTDAGKELAIKKHDSRISFYRPVDYFEQKMIHKERYIKRGLSGPEIQSMMKWELKNHRSKGALYAQRLHRALTPNPSWK